jgi:cytochrome c peroxidase
VLNRGLSTLQFWDGRAASLEEQALQPIGNSAELDHSVEGVVADLKRDSNYVDLFAVAFAEPDRENDEATTKYVTAENLAKSLASFQRTLLTDETVVDEFQRGVYSALSTDERQGLWIFESRGRCWKCHTGHNYSDEGFHSTGIGHGRSDRDLGRFEVTKKSADRAKFKTPTLRAVAKTAPYMHDGSLKTLKDVVEFYSLGGASDDPTLDREIKPLGLSDQEIAQLVAFLEALSR